METTDECQKFHAEAKLSFLLLPLFRNLIDRLNKRERERERERKHTNNKEEQMRFNSLKSARQQSENGEEEARWISNCPQIAI